MKIWNKPSRLKSVNYNRLLSKLACAGEVQGVDGAQKLSVQKLLDASSTGATKQFTAEVEFRKKSNKPVKYRPLKSITFNLCCCFLPLLILCTLRAEPPSPSSTPSKDPTSTEITAPSSTPDNAVAPLTLPLTIDLIPMEGFSIARKCVSIKEYCAFLNAVASTGDPYHLYKPQMSMDPRTACLICTRIGDLYSYSVIQGTRTLPTRVDENGKPVSIPIGDLPITWVTVCDAARFCNWMHFGQPVGAEGPGITESDSTHPGAYTEGYIPTYTNKLITRQNVMDKVITPQPGAQWCLPTQDEWNQFEFLHSNDDGDKDYWQWINAWKKFSGYLAKSGLHLEDHFYYPETPMINFGIRLVKAIPLNP